MSSFAADIFIWLLLFVGVVFAGFGLMGLMIFPDTRSRMFTAFRATGISCGAVILAALVYAVTLFSETGSGEYAGLIISAILLVIVLAAGTWVLYGIIRERTRSQVPGPGGEQGAGTGSTPEKNN